VLLVTGETAFFYDSNAFWGADALPSNLKIVVINNGGGVIFRLIDGPAHLPERTRFFENPHTRTAQASAQEFGLHYHACQDVTEAILLEHLWAQPGPALLEVFCKPEDAEKVMQVLRG
jgi:2-succinyl-5-enolpyruvyl-6-hydroxy-3-cyclohexene-1-carboxylate synthase